MASIYTVTCDHAATGEGRTQMILITRAYGPKDGATNALNRFKEIFGDYYAMGAEVKEGLMLNKSYIRELISTDTWRTLVKWTTNDVAPGALEYFSSLHVNFS
jgi:hypothetical protein